MESLLNKTWQWKLKHLLDTGFMSDCEFVVGKDKEKFKAHRLILSVSSSYFEDMFNQASANTTIFNLGVRPQIFKAILFYIYTDIVIVESYNDYFELYEMAHKFELKYLNQLCTKFILQHITLKNVGLVYELGTLHNDITMITESIKIIKENTTKVLNESSFDQLHLETVGNIFDQNYLNIDSELVLYNALERYAKAKYFKASEQQTNDFKVRNSEEGHRNVSAESDLMLQFTTIDRDRAEKRMDAAVQPEQTLGLEITNKDITLDLTFQNILNKIRFLTLNPQEFAHGLTHFTLFTKDEFQTLLLSMSSKAKVSMPPGLSTNSDKRRQSDNITEIIICKDTKFPTFIINNLSKLKEPVLYDEFTIEGSQWAFKVMMEVKLEQKFIYIQCFMVDEKPSQNVKLTNMNILSQDSATELTAQFYPTNTWESLYYIILDYAQIKTDSDSIRLQINYEKCEKNIYNGTKIENICKITVRDQKPKSDSAKLVVSNLSRLSEPLWTPEFDIPPLRWKMQIDVTEIFNTKAIIARLCCCASFETLRELFKNIKAELIISSHYGTTQFITDTFHFEHSESSTLVIPLEEVQKVVLADMITLQVNIMSTYYNINARITDDVMVTDNFGWQVINFTIRNISYLAGPIYSNEFLHNNCKWRIKVYVDSSNMLIVELEFSTDLIEAHLSRIHSQLLLKSANKDFSNIFKDIEGEINENKQILTICTLNEAQHRAYNDTIEIAHGFLAT